jgi:hypothetical protein
LSYWNRDYVESARDCGRCGRGGGPQMTVLRRPTTYLVMAVLAALVMTAPAFADEEDQPSEDVSSSQLYPIAPAPGPAPAPADAPAPGPAAGPAAEVQPIQVEVGKNRPLPAVVAPEVVEAQVEEAALAFTGMSVLPLVALALGFAGLAVVLIRAGRRRQAGS